jgi:hypothetical protein
LAGKALSSKICWRPGTRKAGFRQKVAVAAPLLLSPRRNRLGLYYHTLPDGADRVAALQNIQELDGRVAVESASKSGLTSA